MFQNTSQIPMNQYKKTVLWDAVSHFVVIPTNDLQSPSETLPISIACGPPTGPWVFPTLHMPHPHFRSGYQHVPMDSKREPLHCTNDWLQHLTEPFTQCCRCKHTLTRSQS